MLDDTIFYAAIILAAFWTNRQIKKESKELQGESSAK